jgi:predicted metal-dependent phosphoesterase TrpH
VRIDLHTHSDRSDGTSTPRELVLEAQAAGLDVVALTDHDTAEGWPEATVAAERAGITLIPGMEISCEHAGHGVHLLGYLLDPSYPPLAEALTEILDGRDQRMPRICERLRGIGIDIDEAQVVQHAVGAVAIGRPHVADTLVTLGVVADRTEAFDRFLSPGRPAYVRRYAPPLTRMIRLVRQAGGVPVVAHVWGRRDSGAFREAGLTALRDAGLAGVEVDHQDHDARQRAELRAITEELGLVVTGASDYHGAGKRDHDLGCNTTAPDQLERILALADEAQRASGRRTPDVVNR